MPRGGLSRIADESYRGELQSAPSFFLKIFIHLHSVLVFTTLFDNILYE
jgi:hypothetical protein